MKSQGLGDTVEAIAEATGKPCKCGERQQALNNPNLAINKILYK